MVLPKPKPLSGMDIQLVGNRLMLQTKNQVSVSTIQDAIASLKTVLGQYQKVVLTNKGSTTESMSRYINMSLDKKGFGLRYVTPLGKKTYRFLFDTYSVMVDEQEANAEDRELFLQRLRQCSNAVKQRQCRIFGGA